MRGSVGEGLSGLEAGSCERPQGIGVGRKVAGNPVRFQLSQDFADPWTWRKSQPEQITSG